MKSLTKIIIVSFLFFNRFSVLASPQSNSDQQNEFAPSDPGVDPSGAPIDQHWIMLIGIAVLFGLYIIYNKSKINYSK